MPVRGENGMKKLLFPFLFTRCRYEIVRYRHFYRHKTMPVSKRMRWERNAFGIVWTPKTALFYTTLVPSFLIQNFSTLLHSGAKFNTQIQ